MEEEYRKAIKEMICSINNETVLKRIYTYIKAKKNKRN